MTQTTETLAGRKRVVERKERATQPVKVSEKSRTGEGMQDLNTTLSHI